MFKHLQHWWFASLTLFSSGLTLLARICTDKGQDILYFSQHRHEILNVLFIQITKGGEFVAYYTTAGIALFVRLRLVLMLTLNGLLALGLSYLLKMFFEQPRPLAWFRAQGEEGLLTFVPSVYVNSSPYTSFPSGHTIGGFALFGYLALIIPQRWVQSLCFLAAALVGISRIYLVQHFSEDVAVGAVFGTIIAYATHRIELALPWGAWSNWSLARVFKSKDRS